MDHLSPMNMKLARVVQAFAATESLHRRMNIYSELILIKLM